TQYGDGSNLLLLHGNSGSKKFFKQYQLDYFANYHTFALDSRGHGQSRSKDNALSYEQQSLDVLNFCKARGITQAKVIGYSDGGNLALWLAVKAPEIFTSVAAISPNTLASGNKDSVTAAINKHLLKLKRLRKFGFPNKKQIMRFELMLTNTGITEKDLQNVTSRVEIIYAERDMVKEEHFIYLAEKIPNCKLHKVMGCHHLNIPFQNETIMLLKNFIN
ncbi:alpha/beta hydrolase, partial [bacterium]|nr:alpha/beta hydrolase [bacterium]